MGVLLKKEIRSDFKMLSKKMHGNQLIYFDSAATSFKPQCVVDALVNYYQDETATVNRSVYQLSEWANEKYHRTRLRVKDYFNIKSEQEIIFTSGATASVNLVAYSYCDAFLSANDEILVPEIEHHSNLVPWQLAAKRRGAKLKFIPVTDDAEIDLKTLKEKLSTKTKLVALAQVSNVFGTLHPIKEIVKLIKEHSNAAILLDGAQSAPHLRLDLQDLGVDFFVASSHKMYGPTGLGILYGRQELLDQMPPFFAGGDMIEQVELESSSYNQLPFKFEAGTPNIAAVIALKSAIDYLDENLSINDEQELITYLERELKKVDRVKVLGDPKKRVALVSFVVDSIHSLDIATYLSFKGVALRSGHLCAQPALKRFGQESFLRVSLGIYNTKEEIDTFIDALKSVIEKLS